MVHLLPGFIIGLREGLEAFLIVTLILEYLNKLEKRELHASVKRGMYLGLGLSFLFGFFLWVLSRFLKGSSGAVGKLWEAGASLTAVLFITYFIFWMIKNGKALVRDVRDSVDRNLSAKGLMFLALVAVAREGAEIALFAFTAENKGVYLAGNLSGVIVAALLAFLIYKSLVKVDIGLIFRITLIYLILQAAYLFGYAVHEFLSALKAVEFLSGDHIIYTRLYDFSGTVLDHKKGALGLPLNVLIGWYSKPEVIQAVLQFFYLFVFGGYWFSNNSKRRD